MNCIVLAWLQWLHLASNFTSLYKLVGIDQFRKFAPEVHLAEDSGALGWSAGALREQTLHVHLASVITESWQTSLYDKHCRFSILFPFLFDIETLEQGGRGCMTWLFLIWGQKYREYYCLSQEKGRQRQWSHQHFSVAQKRRRTPGKDAAATCCNKPADWVTNKVLALRKNSYVDTGPWNQIE